MSDKMYKNDAETMAFFDQSHTELEQAVIEALSKVFDKEFPIDVYNLGLIRRVEQVNDQGARDVNGQNVLVKMMVTAPHCPVVEELKRDVFNGAQNGLDTFHKRKAKGAQGKVIFIGPEMGMDPVHDRSMIHPFMRDMYGM